jgi:hypothetical protein
MDPTLVFVQDVVKKTRSLIDDMHKHLADRPAWTLDDPSRKRFDAILGAAKSLEAALVIDVKHRILV